MRPPSASAWGPADRFGPLAVIAATVWAYRGSLGGPFIWDDLPNIPHNPALLTLGPGALLGTSRPLVQLSFAFNHALGGFDVTGYHVFNLAAHVLAALALWVLVRDTLRTSRLRERFGAAAGAIATAVAALWAVHPLQTEAVTYVVQRAEVMASLCYLLVLVCLGRAAASERPRRWAVAAVASCAVGMACKPIMVTAPLAALLYDRAFLAGSFRAALARRWKLHLALVLALTVLPLALVLGPRDWDVSAGLGVADLTPLQYGVTQLAVVPYYLKLAVWPKLLILDYAWPTVPALRLVIPGALEIGALLALTAWGVARNTPAGFLGAVFVLVLAPTSSVVPISDAAFEHRMYLPLAAIVTLAVAGGHRLVLRLLGGGAAARGAPPVWLRVVEGALVVAMVAVLAHATVRRNQDYRSAIAIWTDTVTKHPINPRPYVQLGLAYAEAGRPEDALRADAAAVRINPDYGLARGNLGLALDALGRRDEAMRQYAAALASDPTLLEARTAWGVDLVRSNQLAEGIVQLTEAVRRHPESVDAHYRLALAVARAGRTEAATREIGAALALDPGHAGARAALAALAAGQSLPDP